MKQETFNKAQDLNLKIEEIDSEIKNIHDDVKSGCCSTPRINIYFCGDDGLRDRLIANCLTFLRKERAKLQKEFDDLKY